MKKNTVWLAVLFAVLLAAVYLIMERPGEKSRLVGEGELLFEIDSAAVSAIHLKSGTERIALDRRGQEWYVTDPLEYKADQEQVAMLIGLLTNLTVQTVVSSNPEKQSVFQVDSSGTLISCFDESGEIAGLVIGKAGNTISETYVRADGSDDVLLVRGSLTYLGSRPVRDWRDKTIVEIPKEEITSIAYQYGDTTFAVAFNDSVWMIDTTPVDEQAINTVLSALEHFTAGDFVDANPEPAPVVNAVISYGGGQIRFSYLKDRDVYLVQSSLGSQWFEVQKWRANQVLKREKDFYQRDV